MTRITIQSAAATLAEMGRTFKPLATRLIDGKFVAMYEVDGVAMTAAEVIEIIS